MIDAYVCSDCGSVMHNIDSFLAHTCTERCAGYCVHADCSKCCSGDNTLACTECARRNRAQHVRDAADKLTRLLGTWQDATR